MIDEATSFQVATWMLEELDRVKFLYQEEAVSQIEVKFGRDFVYENDGGNPAISRKVLSEFKKLTGDSVVWDRSERMWRRRENYDAPGRQQE